MPFCVIKSKTIKIILAMVTVVVLLALSIEGNAAALVWFGNSSRLVPVYRVDTQEKQVAISFDAAWGADKTEEIIEVLKEYNATATFFLVGFWVDKYPEMVKAIDEAGLEIGTHSNTHPDMAKLNKERLRANLRLLWQKLPPLQTRKSKCSARHTALTTILFFPLALSLGLLQFNGMSTLLIGKVCLPRK